MADDDITIRTATPADLAIVLRHRRAMFEEMGYTDRAALDRMQQNSERFFAVGLEDGTYRGWFAETAEGRVIAGGGVGLVPWPPHPRDDARPFRPMIFNVYTEPEYRRRGIARRLMDVMIEWCSREGYHVVDLHSSDQGRPLYLSMGFTPTSELRLTLRKGVAELGG